MGIAISVRNYLDDNNIKYDSITHRRTSSSCESANASFVPEESLAKGVVLRNKDGYLLSVIPSSQRADLNKVGSLLDQTVALALEEEITPLFLDCALGAVPPIGAAYGMQAIVDSSLDDVEDVYFEAGDHRTLVHLSQPEFHKLMQKSPHNRICVEPKASDSELGFGYFGA